MNKKTPTATTGLTAHVDGKQLPLAELSKPQLIAMIGKLGEQQDKLVNALNEVNLKLVQAAGLATFFLLRLGERLDIPEDALAMHQPPFRPIEVVPNPLAPGLITIQLGELPLEKQAAKTASSVLLPGNAPRH